MPLQRALSAQAGTLDAAAPVLNPRTESEVDVQLAQQNLRNLDPAHSLDPARTGSSETVVAEENGASTAPSEPKPVDQQVIPKNNMPIVMFCLALTTFLAALDQTIVATALSTISKDLNGTTGSLSWVSAAYLLCVTSLAPCYGKLSDYFGRKIVFFSSIVVFIIGSALCGAAQDIVWLCVCRGVQGVGGGGVMQMTQVVVSDITTLQSRSKYTGIIGATWGFAAVVGPLLGGVLTSKASWRWCFWINLPTASLALVLLFFFLNLNPHTPPKIAYLISTFDFLGLFLLVAGLVVLLVGFTSGETSWSSAQTIACLVVGVCTLLAAVGVELKTKRSPIIPPRLFRIRTSAALLIGVFFQAFGFIPLSYYEPLYFQALGSSPLMSGVLMMPFSVGTALFGVAYGFIVAKLKRTKELIILSYLISTLGFALVCTLDETSSRAKQMLYLLVAALGIGPLFQLPMLHIQASMPVKDMATSTATLALMRSVGGTVGISVSGAIYASQLKKRLGGIQGYSGMESGAAVGAVQGLVDIQPPELRRQVLNAYARSLNFPWIICTPLLFIGFLISFLLKHYSMERAAVKAPRKGEVVPEERGEKLEEVGTKEDVVAEAEASGRDQRAEVEGTEEVWQREGTKEVV
ncbi:hypothetical protein NBRC10512_002180 [Rhodotorula toruloides]|uniref:RHTO0S02e11144g1_1 n=2 Tax=Rhodotorula toruloides TaxID=5286 RepID=A0A061AJ31_RHOTO|nr:major facilitator superfamily protein [Rhodotorula toruloides NP11]EMS23547.1 major facilitator superfamily protein [Rhodotorula toruloides NP11]KAJ8296545.1 putative transporter C3H1.06c [Rhodotorula toruloides]CDR37138.1 RHTO0S02e11144g1_1 [Rhodotorula toruloides]